MTRDDENEIVRVRGNSVGGANDEMLHTIKGEMSDYSRLFARQNLTAQEFDVYNDNLDMYIEGLVTAVNILGPPEEDQKETQVHSVEGMNANLVSECCDNIDNTNSGFLALAAAGEAAVNGVVLQAVADSTPALQDDYAYYVNDGVYGAFNNIMFDHSSVRPRQLKSAMNPEKEIISVEEGGFTTLITKENEDTRGQGSDPEKFKVHNELYASTVFGPTCDSIDVISRSVLLPKLKVGDWLYFQNMGAYTMAAASSFNGFNPSEVFYVCSIQPEYFETIIAGPEAVNGKLEQKREELLP